MIISLPITDIKKMLNRSKKRKNQITLIHTQLTHKIDLVNLKMIEVMKKELDRPVGFGNHCQNLNSNLPICVLNFNISLSKLDLSTKYL